MSLLFKIKFVKFVLAALLGQFGFSSSATPRSDFLNNLKSWGVLGFDSGFISLEDVGEESLYDAVKKEDVTLLLKRIHDRLHGPFPEFIKDVSAVDKRGRNVFHALAEVQTNQKKFADVMKSLIRLLDVKLLPDDMRSTVIEVANVIIASQENLKRTPFIRDLSTAESNSTTDKKMEDFFTKESSVKVLSYLHSQTSWTSDDYWEGNAGSQSFIQILLSRQNLDDTQLADVPVKRAYLMKDTQNLSPEKTAVRSGNFPAFKVFRDIQHLKNFGVLSIGQAITMTSLLGMIPGAVVFGFIDLYDPSMGLDWLQGAGTGFVAGGLTTCAIAFRKHPFALYSKGKSALTKTKLPYSRARSLKPPTVTSF